MRNYIYSLSLSVLCAFAFYACQKTDFNSQTLDTHKNDDDTTVPSEDLIEVKEGLFRMPSKTGLQLRVETSDIEDVIAPPAGSAPATDSCEKLCPTFPGVTDCETLCHLIRLSKNWEIKPGQRFGLKNNQSTCTVETQGSAFSCYKSPTGQLFCGYDGREKVFPLTINKEGNYRIQLSAASSKKDFDVFIYRKTTAGAQQKTSDEKELVAHSRLSAGRTETIHINETGRYHVFVDEYSNGGDCQDGDFLLSVSPDVNILTLPKSTHRGLIYQFKVVETPLDYKLIKWSFRVQNTEGGDFSDPIELPHHAYFSFGNIRKDYLVAPVYWSEKSQEKIEGKATLIRP